MPRLSASGFPETFYLEKRVHLNLVIHNPIVTHFTVATSFLSSLSLLFGMLLFFCLSMWLFINLVMRKQTHVSITTRFIFTELNLGRMPIFSRRSRAGTFQIISARLKRMDPWLHLPRILLFLDTLRPRDAVGSEGVAAVCSGFCARPWVSWRKLQRSPCEHWPFSFHW